MKVLTEQEVKMLAVVDALVKEFNELPYWIPNEKVEFTKRTDDLKQIIAIRAMLRSGDGIGPPKEEKQIEGKKNLLE